MNNYSAQAQAQKGFKTFVLTLSVSLIVFSVIYYFISESQSVAGTIDTRVADQAVKGVATTSTEETPSAFKRLSSETMVVPSRTVLAGATTGVGTTTPTTIITTTETTRSGVPATGVTEITMGLIFSGLCFALGLFVISKDPRRLAVNSFERKMLK